MSQGCSSCTSREETPLARGDGSAATDRVRVLVVYHHGIVATMLGKLLGRDRVDVLGPFRPDQVSASLLERLSPDVVVIDQEAWSDLDSSQAATLVNCGMAAPLRLVLVDLSNDAISLWSRETIAPASGRALIRMVLGDLPAQEIPPPAA